MVILGTNISDKADVLRVGQQHMLVSKSVCICHRKNTQLVYEAIYTSTNLLTVKINRVKHQIIPSILTYIKIWCKNTSIQGK